MFFVCSFVDLKMYDAVLNTITESWLVLGEMAPYLLLGFLMAGVLSVCVSPAWVERHLGGRGLGPVLAASLLGVPLPLCSCGVIPVSASLRRHGASRGATTAFLLSTPQTGVDSIAVTYALLGPVFALFRPLVALVTGIVGGLLVQLLDPRDATNEQTSGREKTDNAEEPKSETCTDGCTDNCANTGAEPSANTCTEACCLGQNEGSAVIRALRYGLVTLPRDIGPALAVGILIAGVLAAVVPEDGLRAYVGGGFVSMMLLMAAGIPLYVCATASVPIAAGLIHLGASPGAALAFLIAGPATNAAALATAWKVLGRRATIVYLATVAASAIGFGLFLDWLLPAVGVGSPHDLHPGAHSDGNWLSDVSAIAMLAVLVVSYGSKRIKAPRPRSSDKEA